MTDRFDDRRGLSPVVVGALMLVVVALLGVVVATMTLGLADTLEDPAPAISNDESIDVALQGNDTDHTLEFVHRSGQSVPADALVATVGDGNGATDVRLGESSAEALDDGTWSAGERLRLDLDESSVCEAGGDSAPVRLTYQDDDGDRSFTVSERPVPVERGEFVIRGDSLEATTDYTANVKFLGTGWSSPSYDAPVEVSVRVEGTEERSWTSGDSETTVGSYGVSSQDSGTPLSVVARGKTGPNGGWRTTSESTNAEYLVVLRDGDQVPNLDAGNGQQDVAAYAEDFVEDGEVVLDHNQAVFLFDFNRRGTDHETADYQDAVVLVSFFSQESTGTQVHTDGTGRDVIVCPSETRSASPNGGGNGNGNGN